MDRLTDNKDHRRNLIPQLIINNKDEMLIIIISTHNLNYDYLSSIIRILEIRVKNNKNPNSNLLESFRFYS